MAAGGSFTSNTTTNTPPSRATYEAQTQQQAAACGGDTKLVINLLTVEGEEQVMLKVTVAEVQRTLLKQFGINVGAAINSGNFSTRLLTENALPLTAIAGLGTLPIPGIGTGPLDATTGPRAQRPAYSATTTPVPGGAYGNSGVTNKFTGGNTQLTSACVRSSATASSARWPSRT